MPRNGIGSVSQKRLIANKKEPSLHPKPQGLGFGSEESIIGNWVLSFGVFKERVNNLTKAVDNLTNKVDKLSIEVTEIRVTVVHNTSEISNLKSEMSNLKDHVLSHHVSVDSHQND